jgi:hypothetical protein
MYITNCTYHIYYKWMRSIRVLERLTAHAEVATVLSSISASSDTVKSEGRQMKQCCVKNRKKSKNNPPFNICKLAQVLLKWWEARKVDIAIIHEKIDKI